MHVRIHYKAIVLAHECVFAGTLMCLNMHIHAYMCFSVWENGLVVRWSMKAMVNRGHYQ